MVQDCQGVNDALRVEVKECQTGFRSALVQTTSLSAVVEERNEALGKWYRNPGVIFPLGVVVGLLIGGMVQK